MKMDLRFQSPRQVLGELRVIKVWKKAFAKS